MKILTTLYGETCSSWRQLTEVRFKLLGFVPTVSAAVLIGILARPKTDEGLTPITQTLISILGLLVTLALYMYDVRNSQLYDDLISRGRKIEEEIGVDTGQFLGRKDPSKKFFFLLTIKHDIATNIVYFSASLAWIMAIIYIWRIRFPQEIYLPIHIFFNPQ